MGDSYCLQGVVHKLRVVLEVFGTPRNDLKPSITSGAGICGSSSGYGNASLGQSFGNVSFVFPGPYPIIKPTLPKMPGAWCMTTAILSAGASI